MDFYIGGRRSGKTSLTVDWFLEDPAGRTVVVPNASARRNFLERVESRLGARSAFIAQNIIAADNFDASTRLRGRSGATAIDNLDDLLESMLGNVGLVTATGLKVRPDDQ